MNTHLKRQLGLTCLVTCVMILAGCAPEPRVDESVQARLTLLELKLDALEGKQGSPAPVEVESVKTPESAAGATSSHAGLNGAAASVPASEAAATPKYTPPVSRPATPKKTAPATPKAKDVAEYETALNRILAGKSVEGRKLMTEFMEHNPNNRLEPNALYWIGETWYSEKSYEKAILVFKDITTKFPKNDKAAAALYKLGACYDQLKDKGNAQFYWQALVEDFPKSEPAALARQRLAK